MTAAGVAPDLSDTRLLVVAPHPDDETLAAGILMQRVLAAGGAVDVVLLTDGDNNPWPQRAVERRVRIDAAARVRWGRWRRAEMEAALRVLGLGSARLHALGWPDLGVTALALQHASTAVATLVAVLGRVRPSLVVLPALGDHHPDHGSAHVLLRLALAASAQAPMVWTYVVHGPRGPAASMHIDGDALQHRRKDDALAAHASQLLLGGTRLRRLIRGAERFQPLPAAAPGGVLPWQPPRSVARWLRLSVVDAAGATSWRWPNAPLVRGGDGWRLVHPRAAEAGPCFARLEWPHRSPWIFDHWGWCEWS